MVLLWLFAWVGFGLVSSLGGSLGILLLGRGVTKGLRLFCMTDGNWSKTWRKMLVLLQEPADNAG